MSILENISVPASPARRNWLKAAGALAGLSLVAGPSGLVMAADAVKYGGDNMAGGVVDDTLVFLSVGADGIVTIVAHRSEMGQGIRTSLPMVAADELGADWAQVRVQQAPADEARYGSQDTDGSRSMRHSFRAMRHVGATARLMLETAAAVRWPRSLAQRAAPTPATRLKNTCVRPNTGRFVFVSTAAANAASTSITTPTSTRVISSSSPATRSTGDEKCPARPCHGRHLSGRCRRTPGCWPGRTTPLRIPN